MMAEEARDKCGKVNNLIQNGVAGWRGVVRTSALLRGS